jgi:hypothetical protein
LSHAFYFLCVLCELRGEEAARDGLTAIEFAGEVTLEAGAALDIA